VTHGKQVGTICFRQALRLSISFSVCQYKLYENRFCFTEMSVFIVQSQICIDVTDLALNSGFFASPESKCAIFGMALEVFLYWKLPVENMCATEVLNCMQQGSAT
jgi:hypothetical protein